MDFNFYGPPAIITQASPSDCINSFQEIEQSFDVDGFPLKLELNCPMEAKRVERGLDIPIIEEIQNRQIELAFEEEQRKKTRRERNKVAASRCRTKRKHHVRKLLKESEELTKSNSYLESAIAQLKQEKHQLEEVIRTHHCKNMERRFESRRPGH